VQWSGELGYGVRAPEGGQSGTRDDARTGNRALRASYQAHLDDFDRPPDQQGMPGAMRRMREKMELQRDLLRAARRRRRPGRKGGG